MRYVIDKSSLMENAQIINKIAGSVPVIGVVKGNGYGLGTVRFAEVLVECGIGVLAVACIEEAQALRGAGITLPILLLTPPANADIAASIVSLELIAAIDSHAGAQLLDTAAKAKQVKAKAHIKIDTGLGRYGFLPGETNNIIDVYNSFDSIDFTGIYAHFSSSFAKNSESVDGQLKKFLAVTQFLESAGFDCGVKHIANSSAALLSPAAHLDCVRIGSAFLGRLAVPNVYGLHKIGFMECEIAAIKDLPKNHNIGYGDAYKTKKPVRIAIIPIGHTHGFGVEKRKDCFRLRDVVRYILNDIKLLFGREKLYCRIGGEQVPVIGRIGLTHTAVDISGVACELGDIAVFEINPLQVDAWVERVLL
ncbi:MAG TPA: alanine racemase [Clostridia bacterium]|nr:alanine racemase [Clostridia bacterium]